MYVFLCNHYVSETYKYLSRINHPGDLKILAEEELIAVSDELRRFIIESCAVNPGHFAASLGVVELTVALHYAMNAPEDKIIWDVGHQAYGHKILTGRRDRFYTNRQFGGLSGFPKMSESEYDAFGTGHSSTSISAALGIAVANHQHQSKNNQVVAIIGDGSLTGGMAFEGLNNAGSQNTNLLVILNDNTMAIDPSVGALKEYLVDIVTSKTYNKVKTDVWNMLGHFRQLGPNARAYIQNMEHAVKSMLMKQGNLFEAMNLRYFGPIDGHDVVHLAKLLTDLRDIPGPKLLHCITVKGKGFPEAEKNQTRYHAPGRFDKVTGEIIPGEGGANIPPLFQEVFGHTLVELAETNQAIVGITPAMPSGCSMNLLMEKMPDRAYDVGIAEQHAVTFAAGLASQGLVPFCNIYSSFLQRAYDQVIHDVALQNLPVVLCLDRGGLVGPDGPTHHGVYDLSFLRCIPGLIIASPYDEVELRNLMYTAQKNPPGPFVIRYPRGRGTIAQWRKPFEEIPVGKGRKLRHGSDLAILSLGPIGNLAEEATAELSRANIEAAHYDMRFVKPLDEEMLHDVFSRYDQIITIEDGCIQGGFGCAVLEFASDHNYRATIRRLGVPDRYIEHGTIRELYRACCMDTEAIVATALSMVQPRLLSKAV